MRVKLTKKVIDEAVPALVNGEPRARLLLDTGDGSVTGFGVYVGRGEPTIKTFITQRRVGGIVKRTAIDRYGRLALEQKDEEGKEVGARERARALLVDMGNGVDHAEKKREARAKGITLEEALKAKLKLLQKRKKSQRTMDDYQRVLKLYSGDWMNKALATIDDDEVEKRHQRIATDIAAGKYAPRLKHRQQDGRKKGTVIARADRTGEATANLWQRVFQTVYNHARVKNKTLPENPAATVERYTIIKERRTIPDADLPTWWAGVNAINEIRRDALKVALLTGLRRTSVVELRWSDVALDAVVPVLHVRKPKGGEERAFDVPLSDYLVGLLRERKAGNARLAKLGAVAPETPWLFPATLANPSKSGHLRELRHDIQGVQWQPHDLRRVFATAAESIDISKYALKALLNHSQPKDDVTGKYITLTPDRLREPMQKITDRLLRLVEPQAATITPIGKARGKKARR